VKNYLLLVVLLFVTSATISQSKTIETISVNASQVKDSEYVKALKERELALEKKYNKLKQKLEERKTKELHKEQMDVIASINEAEAEKVLIKNEERRLAQIRINDSIAEVNERKRIATLYKNEQQRQLALIAADSIAKAKKEQRLSQRLAERKAKEAEKQNTEKAIAARKRKNLKALAEARAIETETLSKALEAARKEIEILKQQQTEAALVAEKAVK
jgi:hypothetical protein